MERRRYETYLVVLFAMLFGTIPFKANNMEDLHNLIVNGRYTIGEGISIEAKNLLSKILEVDPKKRLTIPEILSHIWFDDYNDEIKLLNPQEKKQIQEEFFTPHNKQHEVEDGPFTEHHLDTSANEQTKNNSTRSIILAPFNTTLGGPTVQTIDGEIKEKSTVVFTAKVREIDRQYERNNNCEVDNGVYNKDDPIAEKASNQFDPFANANEIASNEVIEEVEVGKPKKKCIPTVRLSKPLKIDKEIVNAIEEFGFSREFIESSLLKNEMNHATATYYLLADEKVAH